MTNMELNYDVELKPALMISGKQALSKAKQLTLQLTKTVGRFRSKI